MAIPGFFRTPKPKKFEYRPLFYDPDKEEREERNRQIARELGVTDDKVGQAYQPGIHRGSMKSFYQKNQAVRRTSNLRLVLIVIFLLFVTYLILFR